MGLVENGQLALTDRVFGQGARLGTTYGTQAYGANEQSITLDHLLTHTSGYQNGGWISSAIDLLRFLRVVDRRSTPSDLLSAATVHDDRIDSERWLRARLVGGRQR